MSENANYVDIYNLPIDRDRLEETHDRFDQREEPAPVARDRLLPFEVNRG